MGLSAEAEETFSAPFDVVFNTAVEAIPTVPKMVVRGADASTGRIDVRKRMSFKSWGETVSVDVAESAPGRTTVKVRSRLTAQLVDWGANRQNVRSILAALGARLGTPSTPDA